MIDDETTLIILIAIIDAIILVITRFDFRPILRIFKPRIVGITFGVLLFIIPWFVIPDPNSYANTPWPHRLVHVYCSHAFIWVYLDVAENECHPGPISSHYMSYYQMLAKYPVYNILLNMIPLTYPIIVVPLLILASISLCNRKKKGELRPIMVTGVSASLAIAFYYVIYFGI
ncbi:MAG: hypothetical protein WA323_24705 [Candidatus Nitrosopolaris sp.]|jgi:hypothetical protein